MAKKLRISQSKVCYARVIRAIFWKAHSSSGETPMSAASPAEQRALTGTLAEHLQIKSYFSTMRKTV